MIAPPDYGCVALVWDMCIFCASLKMLYKSPFLLIYYLPRSKPIPVEVTKVMELLAIFCSCPVIAHFLSTKCHLWSENFLYDQLTPRLLFLMEEGAPGKTKLSRFFMMRKSVGNKGISRYSTMALQ